MEPNGWCSGARRASDARQSTRSPIIAIADYDLVFRLEEPEEAEETETRTLLWKKGMADAPIPTEVHRHTTEPGPADPSALLPPDVSFSSVASVDADLYTTSVLPGVSEDPVQLARRLKAGYEIPRAAASRYRLGAKDTASRLSMTALRRAMEDRQAPLCRDASPTSTSPRPKASPASASDR